MSISFAGVNVCLLTDEYGGWLNTHHSLTDFDPTDDWGYSGYGLDHLPLPSPPLNVVPPEVGTLYWPTGLTNYANVAYVVSDTQLADIRTALSTGAGPADLVLTDGTGASQTFKMYLAGTRPLAQITGKTQAHLIHLVDKRYFLRPHTGSVTATPASWSALLSSLSSSLGVTLTPDTIATEYATPSDRWVFYQKPLSVVVDAVCNAIGHRVVANTDGTFKTVTVTTSRTDATAKIAAIAVTKTAGGFIDINDVARSAPATTTVVFRDHSSADPHTVDVTLSSLSLSDYGTFTGVSGQTETIYGELLYDGTNGTACTTYANKAATDYYLWRLTNVDATYPGVTNWSPTGWEDRTEWKYDIHTGTGRILTRIVRSPFQVLQKGGFESPSPPTGGTTGTECVGCEWASALRSSSCLLLTVESMTGACSGTVPDPIHLKSSDGLTWATDQQTNAAATISLLGTSYSVSFTKGDCNGPCLTLTAPGSGGATYTATRGCCGCCYAVFGIGQSAICTGTVSGSLCENIIRIKVECSCCPLSGYTGAGWYCVRTAGSADPCTAAELLDSDKCDSTIEICSGPYADRATAVAACSATDCCPSNTKDMVFTVTSTTGSCGCAAGTSVTLTYKGRSGGVDSWDNTGGLNNYEPCNYPVDLSITCDTTTHTTTFTCTGATPGNYIVTGCSPYTATADVSLVTVPPSLNCDGTITFAVTQP